MLTTTTDNTNEKQDSKQQQQEMILNVEKYELNHFFVDLIFLFCFNFKNK